MHFTFTFFLEQDKKKKLLMRFRVMLCKIFLLFNFSTNEVSFDERIALELDALDHLGTVESPVAERQSTPFQGSQPDVGDEEDDNQHKAFDKVADVQRVEPIVERPEQARIVDCDEVRIMIKVLGPKVCTF